MVEIKELTDIGVARETNEDSYVYIRCILNDQEITIASVCDGMGGLNDGGYASKEVCESLKRCVYSESFESVEDLRRSILTHIKQANRTIYKSKTQYGKQCGTTVTTVMVVGNTAYVWHVGDSRLVQVSGDDVKVLTQDQTYVGNLLRTGQITANEAKVHPKRNSLTNAIGVFNDVTVDMFEFTIDNSFLVIATDGFYNGLSKKDYIGLSQNIVTLRGLMDKTISKGETDNITALTLKPIK